MTEEKILFTALRQLADGISAMYGRNCEVAVHDVSNPARSLIYLAGNITGRKKGAPATDLLIKEMQKNPHEIEDIYNYKTTTKDGRSVKSTTMFIRNSQGTIFAAFCINFDTTEFFNAAQTLAPFINTLSSQESDIHETFSGTATETIETLFEQSLLEMGKQPASMLTPERSELVARLEEQGVFQMKGAVKRIAQLCGVSQFTIYNYLKRIKKQKNYDNEKTNERSYPN